MTENDLGRHRPIDVARVWGTAFGQFVDLWQTTLAGMLELGSGGEQAISARPVRPVQRCGRPAASCPA